jgi:hypothetical protein
MRWVTIMEATMVRYHHDAYDRALEAWAPAERRVDEETFAGSRFARNQMGYSPGSNVRPVVVSSRCAEEPHNTAAGVLG